MSLGEVEWRVASAPVDYPVALATMEERVAAIRAGTASELIWLVEHPPLYTAGTSAKAEELLDGAMFPVFETGRGGRYTYHGPGQRVVYVMLDLGARGRDLRRFVAGIERWIIGALAQLGVAAFVAPGRIGVWIGTDAGEAKIAAIGVRVRHWVTLHGLSINVAPDLTHFTGIVPCGLAEFPVTSLAALGNTSAVSDVDTALFRGLAGFLGDLANPLEGRDVSG